MSSGVVSVSPRTPLHDIHKMMLAKDAGTIIVKERGKVMGIINRTDVLKNVYGSLFVKPSVVKRKVVLNLSNKMNALLPKEIIDLLKKIGILTNRCGYGAFIVGGLVRDLLLGARNLDMDIVIEGDAIEVGRIISQEFNGTLVVHKRFGTCTAITRDRLKIDLATARKEIYEKPAALPKVEFSSLKSDLIRRDFTINAMAASINKENFGQLIDFFGGESDLGHGRIKVMHDRSFIDDPTRIFRAVRFEQRLGFTIDPDTEELIQNAMEVRMFDRVEPQRIRDEIVLILKEAEPLKALKRMAELHEFRFIHPKIRLDQKLIRLCSSIDGVCRWYEELGFNKRTIDRWLMYLMALLDYLSYNECIAICDKFVFKRGERLRILSYKKDAGKVSKGLCEKNILPSKTYLLLKDLSYEVVLLIVAKSESPLVKERVKDFFEKYNSARISVKGEDLRTLGLRPGPNFKKVLDYILYAKINDTVKTKKDELDYAKKLVRNI